MFKTPKQYADQMLALFYGDKELALAELFNAAKANARVPNTFWRDCFIAIQEG